MEHSCITVFIDPNTMVFKVLEEYSKGVDVSGRPVCLLDVM